MRSLAYMQGVRFTYVEWLTYIVDQELSRFAWLIRDELACGNAPEREERVRNRLEELADAQFAVVDEEVALAAMRDFRRILQDCVEQPDVHVRHCMRG